MKFLEGAIFKIHRNRSHKKISEVAEFAGISTTKLSDFENGKSTVEDELLRNLYKSIGMRYRCDEEKIKKFTTLFYEFYHGVLFYQDYNSIYEELQLLEKSIWMTAVYPQFFLAKLIYNTFQCDSFFDFEKTVALIESHFDYLDVNQKQIFFDTAGVYYSDMKKYDKALSYFDKASIYGYAPATAMMFYHKTVVLKNSYRLVEAMESIKKAKQYFDEELNISRSLLCSGTLASIFHRMGTYDEAIKLYKQCITHMEKLGLRRDLLVTYNNLTWTCLAAGYYEKSIDYASKTILMKRDHVPSYFYKAYAFEQLGDRDRAKDFISQAKGWMKSYVCTPYMKAIVEAYYSFLDENKPFDTKYRKLKVALREAEKCNDVELQVFVMKLLVLVLEEKGKKKDLIEYQKRIIQCYEKRK